MGEGGFEFQTPWFIATSFNSLNYRPYFVSTRSIPQDTLQKKPDELVLLSFYLFFANV